MSEKVQKAGVEEKAGNNEVLEQKEMSEGKRIENLTDSKKYLIGTSCVFGILAIILYITSTHQLDSATAAVLGSGSVISIPGIVFSAACAVICAIFAAAAILYDLLAKVHNLKPAPKEPVLFCHVCGIRKREDELATVKLKTRKGIIEKGICQKCLALGEVKRKIVE